MKPKIVIAICIVAIAAYVAYNNYVRVAPGEDTSVKASFSTLAGFIAMSNPMMAQNMIAANFTDKISKDDLLKVIAVKRSSYITKINSVTFNGDFALVSYSRNEVRGDDGEPINVNIVGETWTRDKANPKMWKLYKLADADTWFRTVESPKKKVAIASSRAKDAQEPGTTAPKAGLGAEGRAMRKGERYNPSGKRDPFRPLINIGSEAEIMAAEFCDPSREKEFLEKFDLDTLKLTGIILGEKGPVALIETPDGNGYTVSPNMYLGKRCGKISRIEEKHILLIEQIRKPGGMPGQFTTIDTPMRLRQEDEDSTQPNEQIRKPGGMSGQSTIDSPKRLRREEG